MADERTNILFIMTDQQRGDCLGLDGHPVLNTPNLDYLAHSGTLFRHGYSETPSCIPARRTVMSGQAPATHGMVGMTGGVDWQPDATLAGELSAAGYQCEMIGKLHLWPHRKRFGFHHMLVADSTRGKDNDYLDWLGGAVPIERWAMAHGISPNGWQARPNHVPEEQTHTFWCISQAIEFLSKRDPTVPYFLNVSFIDPHPPFTPPQFYYDRYASRDLGQPAIGDWAPQFPEPQKGFDPEGRMPRRQQLRLDDDTMHYCRAGYFGLINHVDTQIGRLLMYLRDEKLLEETFILFTSDHGEMLGDHNMFAKTRPFESSARVPFLARAPLNMSYPHGIVTDRPVGLQDVMPTLLDAAGLPIPQSVTGRSVLPLMRAEDVPWREALHGEHAGQYDPDDANHYLVDGHTKYVWHDQTGEELLFDLDRDPLEQHNLLHEDGAEQRVAPWRQQLIEQLRDRPEGFTDGQRLIAGQPRPFLVPGVPQLPS